MLYSMQFHDNQPTKLDDDRHFSHTYLTVMVWEMTRYFLIKYEKNHTFGTKNSKLMAYKSIHASMREPQEYIRYESRATQ
ncbi:hypothetical protein SAMN02745781_03259 [Vibrio gazogenes DSM 21264]|uniref:Uncharacterized protein n=1 Tax=Vibrio gazogenes DSM 21264 = NBRC 103151 TaxID=1123492 RepID=A0A1M5EUM2_VIBGA|nr:hypothetical protein SAMN02745781_03259 [Vibrio gazogenes DSM 21264] [Vibrio gazogenes DSM 21264 = NBRC 103151]SJN55211.1 hypothetical protein BQ6471_01444 [Vibrio gazogenes]